VISDATSGQLYRFAWWMLLFPGLCLVSTTLSFNLVGEGLRDALDSPTGR
jgi:peptide/nickel transport system permease protein